MMTSPSFTASDDELSLTIPFVRRIDMAAGDAIGLPRGRHRWERETSRIARCSAVELRAPRLDPSWDRSRFPRQLAAAEKSRRMREVEDTLSNRKGGIVIRLQGSAAFLAVTSVLGLGVATYAQREAAGTPSSAVNVTDKVLRAAGTSEDPLPGSWLTYGRDQSETRYSTLKQIDSSNAKRLGLTWSYVMGAGGGN